MTRKCWYGALVAAIAVTVLAVVAQAQTSTALGKVVVEGKTFEGDVTGAGPWLWSKGVRVISGELTLTCDTLRAWPAKTGREFERIEAEGNVHVNGAYLATDKTKWTVQGTSESATFDRKTGTGVLRGTVDFHAVNTVTGSKLNVQADKLIYDQKTQKFRFERAEKPVRMEFEEPQKPAVAPPAAEGKK